MPGLFDKIRKNIRTLRAVGNTLRAYQLNKQTKNIKPTYIGGTTDEARAEFWRQEPVMQHAVDSIANEYGINPEALKYRIDREGFTDNVIYQRNYAVKHPNQLDVNKYRGYKLLHSPEFRSGVEHFGLDDVGTMIFNGDVKPINENWYDGEFTNEKGRTTKYAESDDAAGNIGLTAATLKYFNDKAKSDFPKASQQDLDRYGLAYYNRGASGGKKWVENGAKGYNFRRRLESRGTKSK